MKKDLSRFFILSVPFCVLFPFLTRYCRISGIIFFDGVLSAIVILLLQVLCLHLLRITRPVIASLASLTFSFNVVLLTLIPVTVERSISIFLLNSLRIHGPLTKDDLNTELICDYVMQQHAITKRLQEQETIASINGSFQQESPSKLSLTKEGTLMLDTVFLISKLFGISPPPTTAQWATQDWSAVCRKKAPF